jgi:large subunit ribosomal protein L30
MLQVKLVRSLIGNNVRNRATVRALGLRKMNQVVEHRDTPTIRGMIHHVKHMLEVTEVADGKAASGAAEEAAKPKAKKSSRKKAEEPTEEGAE